MFKENWKYITLIAIVAFLMVRSCNSETKAKQQVKMFEAALDTMRSVRNDMGQMQSSISSFRTTNEKYFTEMQSVNDNMTALQDLVRNTKGTVTNATIHTVETFYKDTGRVEIKYIKDTTDQGVVLSPQFPVRATYNTEWFAGEVEIFPAFSEWKLKTYNEFEYTNVSKKRGFLGWKGTDHTINVTNKNPHTETTNLASYVLYEKPKRIGVGIQLGASVFVQDKTVKVGPTVGLGISYNFLNF